MKNLILLFAFVFAAGLVSAQEATVQEAVKKTCSKTGKVCTAAQKKACAAKSSATASTDTEVLSASAAAELAAEKDENISRKECPMSGNITYYQKSVCADSGSVKMTEVKYCSDSEAFVNASPSEVMSEGQAKAVKTAETVDGAVQKSTTGAKKKCCKGKKKCGSKADAGV